MNDSSKINGTDNKKRNLTIRFCVAAIIVTSLIVGVITAASYYQMRAQSMEANLNELAKRINSSVFDDLKLNGLNDQVEVLLGFWQKIEGLQGVTKGAFFDPEMNSLWASADGLALSSEERGLFSDVLDNEVSKVIDNHSPRLTSLRGFYGELSTPIPGFIPIRNAEGTAIGMLKLTRDYEYLLSGVEQAVARVFWFILAGHLLLFFALFYNFSIGLQTIETQEKKLSQQITRLSNLLSINKSMQKSMKTASSRAVELNEQFLRRVGSDLHDGPAQSIGYAILRLDRVSREEMAKSLSHEFHVVKEALDSSLTEIRGISSGLVLPELEQMTLEQSLKKVVSRHTGNSDTEVSQYYKDLPDQISLPIKICAYRFVQEGLNNSYRHGQAEKCRVTAYVKDDVLHLSLKDNGMGFRKSQLNTEGGHLGLMGLKDRIESLGGRFSINSELGVGTAIKVSVALYDDL